LRHREVNLRALDIAAAPFAHAVVDELLSAEELAALQRAFLEEPRVRLENELYLHERGTSPPVQEALRAFCGALSEQRGVLAGHFGVPLEHLEGAAYLYRCGDYLLPHSDSGHSRALAYAFYLNACERGGELELFACTTAGGEIVRTRPAKRIAPRANRLVLFTVGETALHQIREVTEGERASISGWLYP
jgi:Rps23 Pro-64 3,4-dihydroxylase Tpa1-like proline 4-hydroxylase